jgi:flagellar protein FlgJ
MSAQVRRGDPRAIAAVAGGLESLFASMLIKQMRQTLEPESLFGGDRSDILGGLFDYTLGQHLGQAGALGISAMIRQYMTPRGQT